MSNRLAVAAALARQADICAATPAPLYAELCRRCAAELTADVHGTGPVARLVAAFAGDPAAGALPLRLLAGVHACVLGGTAGELARHYPSVGGTPTWPAAWAAFAALLEHRSGALRQWLDHPPQTNEVGRSAMLLAGLLTIAHRDAAPLQLLELGASAGLNQHWHRYGYRLGDLPWGDPASPVQLRPRWRGPAPPSAQPVVVARRACDLRPLDIRDAAVRERLCAFVWPDHRERLATLRAALTLALSAPASGPSSVEQADAAEWLPRALAERSAEPGTVVFHSSVWGYLPAPGQQRIAAAMAAAATRATARAPLHWLRWEDPPGSTVQELRLQSWPGGREVLLARGHAHAHDIEWFGDQPISR